MKCAKSRKVKYSASLSASAGTPAAGCRAASSATMRGEAEPTWCTCSSAFGRPAMKSASSVMLQESDTSVSGLLAGLPAIVDEGPDPPVVQRADGRLGRVVERWQLGRRGVARRL